MLFQKRIDRAFALQQQLNRERCGESADAEKPLEGAMDDIAQEEVPLPPQLLERQKEEKLTFKMNGLVPMPILSMVAAAIGIFLCAIKNKAWGSAIFPIISGWALANAMMTHPILQTGANCQLMQTLGVVTAIVGAVTLVTSLTHYILDYIAYKKAMAK